MRCAPSSRRASATLQATGQALKAKQDKLQKDAATMTEEQRARPRRICATVRATSSGRAGELQDDENARRNEELSRLQRTLLEEVRAYAKAQNLDMVVSGDAVLYAAPTLDITPAVLAALQSKAAAAPAARPAAAPAAQPPAKPQGK